MSVVLACASKDWDDYDLVRKVLNKYETILIVNEDFERLLRHFVPEKLIAFHKDESRGTQIIIDNARAKGIPVEVIHNSL